MDKLQLGWIVRQEQQRDEQAAARQDRTADTAQRKREHKQSIRRRLLEN